jgi:hypothetical protein
VATPEYAVDGIMSYMTYYGMSWEVEFSDEFGE